MYIVLLSGGSGKRLWPLSNDLCSKQYIKLMNHDEEQENREKCSMLQRVFGQLKNVGLSENTIVCASSAQVELIESQLDGAAEVAVEPMRRDTFPAVMLSCAYLLSKKGAKEDDVVAFLPVDPYTTGEFFRRIKLLGDKIAASEDTIGLLGGVPTYPSTKYGYIVPEQGEGEPLKVTGFREKPDEATAEKLVSDGALLNCGVFCFKLSMAAGWLAKYGVGVDYDKMVADYEKLPKKSFDYEVLEHWERIVAIKYADLKKKETVIDAYCGIGTIGIVASDRAKRVIGVELNAEAIHDAKINSRMNKIENIEFYANDAGRFMVELADADEHIDVVFMDPPRSGSTEEFLSSVVTLSPRKVVYISCGPDTLARDLKYLTTHGYQVLKITPFDLFPFTEHTEVVTLLTRDRVIFK